MGIKFWSKRAPNRSKSIIPIPTDGPINITKEFQGVNPIGMAYWANIQNLKDLPYIRVALSIGDKITIFTLNKKTLATEALRVTGILHTGEGIFWDNLEDGCLFIPMSKMLTRYDIFWYESSIIFDYPFNIWQLHSNYLHTRFSFTIRNENYETINWGIHDIHTGLKKWNLLGAPDECDRQIWRIFSYSRRE